MVDRILFDKKTKIIATLGPATDDPAVIEGLICAGVDMFRLNVSHRSEPEVIDETVARVKGVAKNLNRDIGIFMDLQGPKIRIGTFSAGKVSISKDDQITLTTDQVDGTSERVSVSYSGFVRDVEVGEPLFIDDGKIQLKVISKSGNNVVCLVEKLSGDQIGTVTNYSGGILGGISSGEPIIVRAAIKPASSIRKTQDTVSKLGDSQKITVEGRHDPCICPRAVPVLEAMAALVVLDLLLIQKSISN
jgi:pyruvate kinase